jgi:hypothetical protein
MELVVQPLLLLQALRLGHAIDSIGAKRVVLDTIEALFSGLSNTSILRAELRRLFRWLKEKGVTAIVTGLTRGGSTAALGEGGGAGACLPGCGARHGSTAGACQAARACSSVPLALSVGCRPTPQPTSTHMFAANLEQRCTITAA